MTLSEFFKKHNQCAIAFSGGVDSSYLLYEAIKCNAKVKAYYVKSAFQPQFELDDAIKMSKFLNADMEILPVDVLEEESVAANPANRCYYCKEAVFKVISEAAHRDGFFTILDGTNASDDADDRPGMKVLEAMKVLSPLRECGLTKDKIRELSKDAGLFTWCKPSYACLATRIKTGEKITFEKLSKTEKAESFLFSLGFRDFRVRMVGDMAKLQVSKEQMPLVLEKRLEITGELKKYYSDILLDLEAR
jgi:uncharacterized protein